LKYFYFLPPAFSNIENTSTFYRNSCCGNAVITYYRAVFFFFAVEVLFFLFVPYIPCADICVMLSQDLLRAGCMVKLGFSFQELGFWIWNRKS
jgi:hypothetical protein